MTPQNFSETLKQKLEEKANYNKDLIDEKNSLEGELISAPNEFREALRNTAIRDPFAREQFVTNRLGGLRSGLGTVTDLLNARGQQFSNVVGQATNQYAQEQAAAQAAAARAAAAARYNQQREDMLRQEKKDDMSALREGALAFAIRRGEEDYAGGGANATFKALMGQAQDNNLGITSEELWQMMGNTAPGAIGGGGVEDSVVTSPGFVNTSVGQGLGTWGDIYNQGGFRDVWENQKGLGSYLYNAGKKNFLYGDDFWSEPYRVRSSKDPRWGVGGGGGGI